MCKENQPEFKRDNDHTREYRARILRLLAELHHSRAARIRVAGGGAGGDAPDAQASALGLPYGQPQPPKRLSPSWDTTATYGLGSESTCVHWPDCPRLPESWTFSRCGGQARTVSPLDVTIASGSQLTHCVEVAAEPLADVEEQTVRSVHQAQRPGRESPTPGAIRAYGLYAICTSGRG